MKKEVEVSYHNDVFFKYALSREDEDSKYIRHSIIEALTGIKPKDSRVSNPELNADIFTKKDIILDVYVVDERGYAYDIEMQMSSKTTSEMKRFEYYGSRMISNQLHKGEDYRRLKPVYQFIFIDAYDMEEKSCLVSMYQMRNKKGRIEHQDALLHRAYIHLPAINVIVKQRGMEHMNAFEKMCYLFKNGETHAILKTEEGLVKKLMEKHMHMKTENQWWSIAEAAEIGKARYQNVIDDYYEEGMKKGIEEGKLEGIQLIVQSLVQTKYQMDAHEWIQTLTLEQLTVISSNILTCDSFNELKHLIENC